MIIQNLCFSFSFFNLLWPHREKGYLEQAAEAVGGEGFDVIIENASDVNLGSDLTIISAGARVVVIMQIYFQFNFLFYFYK